MGPHWGQVSKVGRWCRQLKHLSLMVYICLGKDTCLPESEVVYKYFAAVYIHSRYHNFLNDYRLLCSCQNLLLSL
jgi:hypothetical protein